MSNLDPESAASVLERAARLEHVTDRHDKDLALLVTRVAHLERVLGSGDPTELRPATPYTINEVGR